MGGLLDALDQDNLDNQRDVVKNEKRQTRDNQPYGSWLDMLHELGYPEGHPYHHTTIGSMAGPRRRVARGRAHLLLDLVRPGQRRRSSIVGDVDTDEALALADTYFGGDPAEGWVPDAAVDGHRAAARRRGTPYRHRPGPGAAGVRRLPHRAVRHHRVRRDAGRGDRPRRRPGQPALQVARARPPAACSRPTARHRQLAVHRRRDADDRRPAGARGRRRSSGSRRPTTRRSPGSPTASGRGGARAREGAASPASGCTTSPRSMAAPTPSTSTPRCSATRAWSTTRCPPCSRSPLTTSSAVAPTCMRARQPCRRDVPAGAHRRAGGGGMTLIRTRPEPGAPRPWQFPSFERRDGRRRPGPVGASARVGRWRSPSLVIDAGAALEPRGAAKVSPRSSRGRCRRALRAGTPTSSVSPASGSARPGVPRPTGTRCACGFEVPVGELAAATALLADAVRAAGVRPTRRWIACSTSASTRSASSAASRRCSRRRRSAQRCSQPASRYAAPTVATRRRSGAQHDDIRRYRDARRPQGRGDAHRGR